MKTLMICSALIMTGACRAEQPVIPEEFRVRPGKVVSTTDWPGNFKRIVAVTYDYKKEKGDDVVIDGRLHKGVIRTSEELNPEQIKKLYSAITGVHSHQKASLCFEPHHGFVFYDVKNKILGSLTLCFGCNSYRHSPAGEVSKVFDLDALSDLINELKMNELPRE